METEQLARIVADLAARVERLENPARIAEPPDTRLAQGLIDSIGGDGAGPAIVVYAGAGPWGGGIVAWEMRRPWDEVRGTTDENAARVLTALANGTRLKIVSELLGGELATGELVERLALPSSGQLFHHLKELLAAGIVHQPVRGTYAIRREHAVPLLAVLAATLDLVGPVLRGEPA